MRYTEGKGADVVIDLLGKNETLQQSVLSLAQGGILFMVPKAGNNQMFTSREIRSQLQSKHVTIHEAALSLDPDICCGFTISPRLFTPQPQPHGHGQGKGQGRRHGQSEGHRGNDVVVRPRIHRHKYEFTRGDVNKALNDMKSRVTTGCVLVRISS
jgi:NADPH:quinone reductase-like Zn-dependent oxidoreductase